MISTETLSAWIQQVQGKYINVDGAYGAQCWDLAAHWSAYIGKPIINTGYAGRWVGWAGNMVDAYPQTPAIEAAYSLHGPDERGEAGDIVVWGDSYWYYPATHVAVLIADKGAQLQCMSQNSTPSRADNPYPGASSGPTTIQYLPRQGLIGFIRPRTGIAAQGNITPIETVQEDDMATVPQEEWDTLKLQVAGLVDNAASNHRDTSGRLDKLPAAIVHEPFVRVGKDGKPNGLTTLASVVGAQEANVELDRGLADAPVTVIVDSLIAADIAKEVLDLLAVRLAE